MNIFALQARLAEAGRDPGPIDGILGKKTYRALFDYMAGRSLGERGNDLALGAARHFPVYSINSPLRLAHFLAQAAHETLDFCFLNEIWGPTKAQRGYEGRADLGNTQPGDGRRYAGRGIFQLTGRANYRAIGGALALPLEAQPELAAEPRVSVLIACHYWLTHGLNALADADDIVGITRRINGGRNGLAERRRALAKAKKVLA